MSFLPVSSNELKTQPDFVLVSGDAYVDHPSFGAAIIGNLLHDKGYTVAVLAQPNWKDAASFTVFGKPRLGFLVTGGNIDSMVNHYTVARKPRGKDSYSPGGKTGLRPDRAAIVYSNKIREAYHDTTIILGGLEASLRRLAHYDYWDDKVRRSILLDAAADIVVYGMGELAVLEIAAALKENRSFTAIHGIVYKAKTLPKDTLTLPPFTQIRADAKEFARSFMLQYENTDAVTATALVEEYPDGYVVQNIPARPLTEAELDNVYALPFEGAYHPMYKAGGGVPAIEEVSFSITSSRGCFGSCHFCALTYHQGRVVQSRSHGAILQEAQSLISKPGFKGYIHDVGGPTANFRRPACDKQIQDGPCKHRRCLAPDRCPQLIVDHQNYLSLLRKLRVLPGVKKVFVRSGIRFDYLMADTNPAFFEELCTHHISGQLKVAPEHVSKRVLKAMGKPSSIVYDEFVRRYIAYNKTLGLKQFLVPYFMSSHPGSDMPAAIELAEYLRTNRIKPEQTQDFYPTPGTLSTCMYHTELDPRTMKPIYVPKKAKEKAMQRALVQYWLPQNKALVQQALATPGISKKQTKKRRTIRNVHKKKKGLSY